MKKLAALFLALTMLFAAILPIGAAAESGTLPNAAADGAAGAENNNGQIFFLFCLVMVIVCGAYLLYHRRK